MLLMKWVTILSISQVYADLEVLSGDAIGIVGDCIGRSRPTIDRPTMTA